MRNVIRNSEPSVRKRLQVQAVKMLYVPSFSLARLIQRDEETIFFMV